ncbi:MAG: hypothetical protein FWH39_01625 [Bacteroidales bacterium]|nr:hypothetical protein [Bacteroidales bacterium]
MDNNLNYTVSTGSAQLPFAAAEQLWQALDAAQQRLFNRLSYRTAELEALEFPAETHQPSQITGLQANRFTDNPATSTFQPSQLTGLQVNRFTDNPATSTFEPSTSAAILQKLTSAEPMTEEKTFYPSSSVIAGCFAVIARDEATCNDDEAIFHLPPSSSTFLRHCDCEERAGSNLQPSSSTPAIEQSLLLQQQDNMSAGGGSGGTVNNYNVSFEHLIGTVNNTFETVQDATRDSNDFMRQLTDALQTILNDTNYSI